MTLVTKRQALHIINTVGRKDKSQACLVKGDLDNK